MSFNWGDYLALAEDLCKTSHEPANLRSAISRAYYSVFGKTRSFCVDDLDIVSDKDASGPRCHKALTEALIDYDDETCLEISNRVSALKVRRQYADYRTTWPDLDQELARDTIKLSKEVIEMMNSFN